MNEQLEPGISTVNGDQSSKERAPPLDRRTLTELIARMGAGSMALTQILDQVTKPHYKRRKKLDEFVAYKGAKKYSPEHFDSLVKKREEVRRRSKK